MGEWRTVKLKEIIRQRKGSTQIDEATEYKLCRVQLHRRGIVLRQKQHGYEIKTKKQQICRAGDLIVAEMDAKYGGYGFIPKELEGAIVSSHYYLYELDKSKITQGYLETLISTNYIQDQIEAKGSTNYSSIRAWEFLEYEIPLPTLQRQNEISNKFLAGSGYCAKLQTEYVQQSTYLTQLRQTILQDAIEGKLTAHWRAQHPVQPGNPEFDAVTLLEQIKAEKQKLIAAKKIAKENSLPPIRKEEMPFDLPEGWVWCRLGEATQHLAEQRAIVERVDRLLARVDALAAQVSERKAQANALMQAVLREAFAG